jgi:hypothetical protein
MRSFAFPLFTGSCRALTGFWLYNYLINPAKYFEGSLSAWLPVNFGVNSLLAGACQVTF